MTPARILSLSLALAFSFALFLPSAAQADMACGELNGEPVTCQGTYSICCSVERHSCGRTQEGCDAVNAAINGQNSISPTIQQVQTTGGGGSGSAGGGSGSGQTLINPLRADSIPELLSVILEALVRLGTIALVLALVYVGFKFVAAQGKDEKIKEAREALMWTVIGGLILLGASGIALVIQNTVEAL